MNIPEIDWGYIRLALMLWAFEGDGVSIGGTQWVATELISTTIQRESL